MYPYFETIRFKNGVLENLVYHQERVNHCFLQQGHLQTSINDILKLDHIPIITSFIPNQVYKCRIKYNLNSQYITEWERYQIRKIESISIVDIGSHSYHYKFTQRDWIKDLVIESGTDDIIMIQNELVKDSSYANLAFFNGSEWHTPSQPLLKGTRRAALLHNKIIHEKEITLKELKQYQKVKLINAMMDWEESITLNFIFDATTNTLVFP